MDICQYFLQFLSLVTSTDMIVLNLRSIDLTSYQALSVDILLSLASFSASALILLDLRWYEYTLIVSPK